MSEALRAFYDGLATDYHTLFADWPASVRRQGEVLDRLIRTMLGDGARTLLDAACGIGTQAIGLALRGHRVHGTDLSPVAVARAAREAVGFGVDLRLGVADLRSLAADVPGSFEVVLACDNALPHLLTDDDLHRALAQIAAKLVPGGLFVMSQRDYDRLAREQPRAETPRVLDAPDGRHIAFQVWDWAADGTRYRLHQFLVRQTGDAWHTDHHSVDYRALQRSELAAAMTAAGLVDLRWHEPEASGYYQPIATARRP